MNTISKIYIPNDLTRPQLDAFRSIETELGRLANSSSVSTGDGAPTPTSNLQDGSFYYDYTNLNLYVFRGSDNSWQGSTQQLHIRYASDAINIGSDGKVPSDSDITDFSVQPYNASGIQLKYRGIWFGGVVASFYPKDYEWTLTSGSYPTFERQYSITAGLIAEMGTPDTTEPNLWEPVVGAIPDTAYWVAERYTIDGVVSTWQLYPVQAKDAGLPFVSYPATGTIGHNAPALNSATWIADALTAVSAFTGRPYSNQKEFGYGTVVVIVYDDVKLAGKLKSVGGVDTWVAPGQLVDGDLIVDGSINANHIGANTITAGQINSNSLARFYTGSVSNTNLNVIGGILTMNILVPVGFTGTFLGFLYFFYPNVASYHVVHLTSTITVTDPNLNYSCNLTSIPTLLKNHNLLAEGSCYSFNITLNNYSTQPETLSFNCLVQPMAVKLGSYNLLDITGVMHAR